LKAFGQNFGLLQFNDQRKNMFTEGKIKYAEMIAQNIGMALVARGIYSVTGKVLKKTVSIDAADVVTDIKQVAMEQLQSLPLDMIESRLTLRKVYHPFNLLSGDYLDYLWNDRRDVLRGFLIDVCGHGIRTAFRTASMQVLFQEALVAQKSWTETLRSINDHALRYCDDGSFAAAICFEFDFAQQVLRCIISGDCCLFADTRTYTGRVRRPGSFIGINEDFDFEEIRMPFSEGDTFYFITDGLFDLIEENIPPLGEYDKVFRYLSSLPASFAIRDDASAICIRINK